MVIKVENFCLYPDTLTGQVGYKGANTFILVGAGLTRLLTE